jgi:ATP-dependent DNA helicase RecG
VAIDLDELARRESEKVEWKEDVADVEDVVAALCAFANDLANLGGGYVVCGAEESTDEHGFQRLTRKGLSASRCKEVEGKVLALCQDRVTPPLLPIVDELSADTTARRILVFTIAATRTAHVFRRRDGTSAHHVRVGRTTRQARNGVLLQLLQGKGVLPPWDERPCAEATNADVDLLALRSTLLRMNLGEASRDVERYLSERVALSPFVPSLCAREPLTAIERPRNFAVLLFGAEPQRFVRSAVSVLSVYPGVDRSTKTAHRHDLAGTILDQFRDLWRQLELLAPTVFDKASLERPNLSLYPRQALLEALVNAVVHRDYTALDPTRVTVFSDRVEVISPGALPPGVSLAHLKRGLVTPKWRNRSLAWFFRKLDLAQAEGQGVRTIRAAMKAGGCPPPRFAATEAEVTCTLYANPRARELLAAARR